MTAPAIPKALVTGGGGFVAATLIRRLLAEGTEVLATLRPGGRSDTLDGVPDDRLVRAPIDLRTPDEVTTLLADHAPTHVFHLATARNEADPEGMRAVIVGTLAALVGAAAANQVRRIVLAGSSTEYGPVSAPLREDGPLAPATMYGRTRAEATSLATEVTRGGVASVTSLRLFHVYGPWEPANRLIPRALAAAESGAALPLTPPGHVHDLVHVDDVVDALLRGAAIETDGAPINVCRGVPVDNHEVVEAVERVTGRSIARSAAPFPARVLDRSNWYGDPRRARDVLGWEASLDLDEGLTRTWRWSRSQHT